MSHESSLRLLLESSFGTSIDAQNNPQQEYVENVNLLLNIISKRAVSPFLQSEVFYWFSNLYFQELRAVKFIKKFADMVIKRRKTCRGDEGGFTLLDMMMREDEVRDAEIRDEANSFLLAVSTEVSHLPNLTVTCDFRDITLWRLPYVWRFIHLQVILTYR